MVCSICYEYGHNKKTCFNYILPEFVDELTKKGTLNSIESGSVDKSSKKEALKIIESDIKLFYDSQNRKDNDETNKKREEIIKLLNKGNPYPNNKKWVEFYKEFTNYIDRLKPPNTHKYTIDIKGGRKYHFDFLIKYYDINENFICENKIEFKDNVSKLNQCPQFVSPMYPSQYFDCVVPYEEIFYQDYLPKICKKLDISKPDKDLYIKQIHSNKPKCVNLIQEAYYKGSKQSSKFTKKNIDIENYNLMNYQSKNSIKYFLTKNKLNIPVMNKYLISTQKDKIYMLWDKNSFHIQKVNIDDYTIDYFVKIKNNNTVVCKTKSNKEINILLRWKNGSGVAFPALQIS